MSLNRRIFLRNSALAAGSLAVAASTPLSVNAKTPRGSGFTMWQIPSHRNTIGNSYVFRTSGGKVVVMDGGFPEEEFTMRGFLGALGNEVEAWFISHPHDDHMGALWEILKQGTQDLHIKAIYHSKLIDKVIDAESTEAEKTRDFYERLSKCDARVIDIQQPGIIYDYDGMQLKILSVANDFTVNPYNNSSMIMRVWDKRKSIVFLGDAGVECGKKVLDTPYKVDLDCDYLQMAHHGQNGCDEDFYRSIKFHACLWPTPLWVWNNDQGKGFNTGTLNTIKTRTWMDQLQIKEHHVSCVEGLFRLD
ncbi:MAG: MBL fold metallo-hydrolase [Bacteroidaceae bacterium]|nr:MBL fold metallo-hydrolase [Bacteroidaceae bacterium]